MSWAKRIGLLLALLGLVLTIVWCARVALSGLSLREHLAQAQAMAADPETLNPTTACDLVDDLRSDVTVLRRWAGWLADLAPILGWLPEIGGDLQAAPHLLVMADGLTEAGSLACDALRPALGALGGTGEAAGNLSLEGMAHLLAQERTTLRQAAAAVERSQAAWEQVDTGRLSPRLANRAPLLDRGLPLAQLGLNVATVAPDLMGIDQPRAYLILALNEDEIRPGGGFITGVGEVRVEGGQLTGIVFRDSYAVDDFNLPYPDAPEPLRRYMGLDLWGFRDSNWSPDFPSAARQAIALYRPGYAVTVDGVVALDQRAVQHIVRALEPLAVEGAEQPVTGDTVIVYMQEAWAPSDGSQDDAWMAQRKAFIGTLAQAVWARVSSGQVEWGTLARTLLTLTEGKHLFVYVDQLETETLLAEAGWGGALQASPGDFLMIVDANLGYNKANGRVREAIVHEVDLRSSPPKATLTLVYTHTSTADVPCIPMARFEPTYAQMMDRCYWDYLRIYVPQGSQLLDATRIAVPGEMIITGERDPGDIWIEPAAEGPWLTFGALMLLPSGATQARSLVWTPPTDVVQWTGNEGTYTLRVQKQPGARDHPLTVRIRLPEGVRLVDAVPRPSVLGDGLVYRVTLDRDRTFKLTFRRES